MAGFDPVSAGLQVIGLGLQLYGGIEASRKAHEAANINVGIAADEQKINAQKQEAMQLSSRRQQLEVFRNQQRLRAQATNAAVNQGAQFGSGLQGGLAQVDDQSLFNAQGINQNLEIGQNIFGINNDISSKKMQLAQIGADQATATGVSSLGGALVKDGPVIGQLGSNAYGWGSRNIGVNPGGPYV